MTRAPRAFLSYFVVSILVVTAISGIGFARFSRASAAAVQDSPLSCSPLVPASNATPSAASPDAGAAAPVEVPEDAIEVSVGYVPVSIYAPVFVALDKGYFAEAGLDVTLEPFAGGPEPITLTASGELDFAAIGAGPAFWNVISSGLPISVIAPGHAEGSPVATPLMISKENCESGGITSVADLEGKKVSVNARGATEYWLGQALATGGLTLDDIDLQVLPFPDAVAALAAGAIDAAMVGEPLATQAENDDLAVRLLSDFPVQDIQPTAIIGNSDFLSENPEAAQGFVTAYLRASRDLTGDGFKNSDNLAIIEAYTGVPATLISQAVQPLYQPDGYIDPASFSTLQTFFRERDQLEYDDDIDPSTFIDTTYVDAAVTALGPYQP
jgi:NitT/TauT family transport system substrate-binding protein